MKEIPILFSAAMVRALLDGSKTQTRRVVSAQPEVSDKGNLMGEWFRRPLDGLLCPRLQNITIYSPYGQPGDRLYVRERWAVGARADVFAPRELDPGTWLQDNGGLWFEADRAEPAHAFSPRGTWRQGMFMPKWASRIWLENIGVRVERLQDISEADAIAEGIESFKTDDPDFQDMWRDYYEDGSASGNPIGSYMSLWNTLNAKRGYGWDLNPWVWVVEFKRIKP
ncbi:hypothetical protein LJR029_007046 [Caballeronia sp. LjRoot29]|uniref:hypothetical protein n=1 Tax=Caballeronia sp. LjRoot29 TaxID=3342315 RepID=UPI003ED1015E